MGNNGGDVLARGAKSCTFGGPKITQERWDAIWTDESTDESKKDDNPLSEETRKFVDYLNISHIQIEE